MRNKRKSPKYPDARLTTPAQLAQIIARKRPAGMYAQQTEDTLTVCLEGDKKLYVLCHDDKELTPLKALTVAEAKTVFDFIAEAANARLIGHIAI